MGCAVEIQEITEGINRYLYSIDKADPTLGKQL
ncbi:DUF3225 domain-containing protein, partial [Salmonella enterica]